MTARPVQTFLAGNAWACADACGADAFWATMTTVGNSILYSAGAGWLCMAVTTVPSQPAEIVAASVRAKNLGSVRVVMVVFRVVLG